MCQEIKNTPPVLVEWLCRAIISKKKSVLNYDHEKHNRSATTKNSGTRIFYTKDRQTLTSRWYYQRIGFTCLEVFRVLFLLVFTHKNWPRTLTTKNSIPFGKDVIYRFLNHPSYAWRKFLLSLSSSTVKKVTPLTSKERVRVFIIDHSTYGRSRSKNLELLAKVKDHTTGKFVRGFRMLTLGWSDEHSFVPVDFALLSSAKPENRYCEMNDAIDKRTHGYKRRMEATQSSPVTVSQLFDHALNQEIEAEYVLMDTWFTHAPLVETIHHKGLHVIGMVKQVKQRYRWENQELTLNRPKI